jgi:CRP-like cAMP-binding protein
MTELSSSRPSFRDFAAAVSRAVKPLVPQATTIAQLETAAVLRRLDRGDHLLRVGDTAGELYFIVTGLVRYYYQDPVSGDERTGQFFDEGLVFTDAAAFLEQEPASQSFEALEPSVVFCVPRAALYAAYDRDHAVERFGRLMLEAALTGSQRRAGSLLTLTSEQLYRRFVETRPEVARRVPQYLIASYLGITPEALSRIRGRIAKR